MSDKDMMMLAEHEQARLSAALSVEEPGSERYSRLQSQLHDMFWLYRNLITESGTVPVSPAPVSPAQQPDPEDAPEAEPAAEVAAEAAGEPKPAAEPEKVDRIALRAALAEAKAKGVNIAELIHACGAGKYSEVPGDKLGELDRMRREAVEALG